MRVLAVILVLVAVVVAVEAARPLRKMMRPALVEKKGKLLPHPTQHYHHPNKENKATPGRGCHELTTCEECAGLHICVWTVEGDVGKCLDERDPASVHGTRESCSAETENGYRDVKSREEDEVEEVANMVGDADMKPDALGGDRVVVRAVDVDDGPDAKEDEEDLTDTSPKWAKNAKHTYQVWHGYDGTKITTHTVEVKRSHKGLPHNPSPASGGEPDVQIDSDQVDPDAGADAGSAAAGGDGEAPAADAAAFRSDRAQNVDDEDVQAIHAKYEALQKRVEELERQLIKEDEEESQAEESGEQSEESSEENHQEESSEDELETQPEESAENVDITEGMEYGADTPLETVDNYAGFDDPTLPGEHEPIVKQTTVTKIIKDADGNVVGEPIVTKTLEQLDEGNTDMDP